MQKTTNKFIPKEINLLKNGTVLTVDEQSAQKTVYVLIAVGSIVFVVASLLVFVISVSLRNSLMEASNLEKQWADKVSSMSDTEISLFTISKKLEAVKKITDTIDFSKIFSSINEVTPNKVNISQMKLDKEGLIFIDGDSPDSLSLIAFFDQLINKDRQNLKYVTLNNLSLSKDGVYRFSISAKYFVNR